jgi:hypothetical protein
MEKYFRTQTKKMTSKVADQRRIVAMADFVEARDAGEKPNQKDLDIAADIFRDVLRGLDCEQAFGFVRAETVGRPGHSGITPSDVVAAYVERELRCLGGGRGALAKAFANAQASFVEELDSRVVQRDWTKGKKNVQPLSSEDLDNILETHRVKDK